MAIHYSALDSADGDYLLLSAELEHDETGISLEFRDGRWIVNGSVSVDSFNNARELVVG